MIVVKREDLPILTEKNMDELGESIESLESSKIEQFEDFIFTLSSMFESSHILFVTGLSNVYSLLYMGASQKKTILIQARMPDSIWWLWTVSPELEVLSTTVESPLLPQGDYITCQELNQLIYIDGFVQSCPCCEEGSCSVEEPKPEPVFLLIEGGKED